ncbi:MAG: hypothetical protein ABIB71_05355 [Candidatus Woesearchaeota archaeon]
MPIKLLIKKLYLDENRIITSNLLRNYCKKLGISYYGAIRYLISNKYLYRILRGVFYKPSVEERKFNRIDINYLDALVEALKIKRVNNWYFGLETAIKLNNLTHEYFTTDFIINDIIFRAKAITLFGHKIKFIKLKGNLFDFGISKNKINFSNPEKTLLDIVYLSRYGGLGKSEINSKISGLLGHCSRNRLLKYSKKYNKSVESFVRELL